ncbi:MAG TPA: paraslipin [Vineibacter sp.]|nr:paraslipin [Vineibacter sp.]
MESFGSIIFVAIVVIVAILMLRASLTVVPRDSNWTVERFGRFHRLLRPGFHFVAPLIDRVGARLDMRETALDVPPQRAMTEDNAAVEAGAVLGYRIVDAVKATYDVADLKAALVQLVGTAMTRVIRTRPIAALATDRAAINAALIQQVAPAAEAWGVAVSTLDLRGIALPD